VCADGPLREERLIASAEDEGTRLDRFLAARLPSLSRSQIQRLIRDGHVTLSRGRAKPGALVTDALVVNVSVPRPAPAVPEPESLPLRILYDDADIVVIDKPAGLVVHPGAGHARGTLVNALLHHVRGLSGIGGVERPGIVHRLDRGTSGVMIVAKHDAAHRSLARQFHDRTVVKEYVALVWGAIRQPRTISQPIGRDPKRREMMSSRARHARAAVTHVVAVEPFKNLTLVHLTISTGRTHQIRVHLSETGHAVVGDALYGGVRKHLPAHLASLNKIDRPFLHASKLTIAHPSDGRSMTFEAPLAEDLTAALAKLKK
jgi:23S rRNA pseudouridine1911/1915/1917 synthase